MQHILLVGLLSILGCHTVLSATKPWGYYEAPENQQPKNWPKVDARCGHQRQSPIHFYTHQVEHKNLSDWDFSGTWSTKTSGKNNGHTITFTVDQHTELLVNGGGLDGPYKALQFHLHWGADDKKGSEHWANSKHYAGEVHIVTAKKAYLTDSSKDHMVEGDGLAVLGGLIEVDGADNPNYKPYIDALDEIEYKNTSKTVDVAAVDLLKLLPTDRTKFFRYLGSLTTPTCNEVVVWTVFQDPVKISAAQMAKLRNLYFTEEGSASPKKMIDNHRLPQELHGRKVWVSDADMITEAPKTTPQTTGADYHKSMLAVSLLVPLLITLQKLL